MERIKFKLIWSREKHSIEDNILFIGDMGKIDEKTPNHEYILLQMENMKIATFNMFAKRKIFNSYTNAY